MLEVQAVGRIITDLPLRQSKDKKKIYTTFLLACKDYMKSTTIRCIAFGNTAIKLHEWFCKQDRIGVSGTLISDGPIGNEFSYKLKIEKFSFVETKAEHAQHTTKI